MSDLDALSHVNKLFGKRLHKNRSEFPLKPVRESSWACEACAEACSISRCVLLRQVGAQAAVLPPRTNVVEMGRYLAQNGISVEQVQGLRIPYAQSDSCTAPVCLCQL